MDAIDWLRTFPTSIELPNVEGLGYQSQGSWRWAGVPACVTFYSEII